MVKRSLITLACLAALSSYAATFPVAGSQWESQLGKYETLEECQAGANSVGNGEVTCTKAVLVKVASIPTPALGASIPKIGDTTEEPVATNIGAFRAICQYSHMNYDDPIARFGAFGTSHLHTFFGNTGTKATSTYEELRSSGNSTCYGGILNRTAYWVPSMVDQRTGKPVKPSGGNFYYKSGYSGILPEQIRMIPNGLRMIAGNGNSTVPQSRHRFKCVGKGSDALVGNIIQNCPVGASLIQEVVFPQCWDGINLDSPDHKSHMSYTVTRTVSWGQRYGRWCPESHPVPLPEITFNVIYPILEANEASYWKLSSDHEGSPPGSSTHADWFDGWDPEIKKAWTENCLQKSLDAHGHLLCNGKMLK